MSNEELRELCIYLLNNAWPAYLATVDKNGFPQIRAMFNLRNQDRFPKLVPLFKDHEDDFFIIFSTNTSSTKTKDINGNEKAAAYYCDPENSRGTMFGGTIEIVPDLELKKAIWHDGWEYYYPKGYDDPDHTILQMKPTVARGWNQSHTFRLDLGEGK